MRSSEYNEGNSQRSAPERSAQPGATVVGRPVEVVVDDRGVERAIRVLKRIVAMEGVLKAVKRRRAYEKPSIRKRRKRREADRRRRRAERRMARRGH